MDNTQKFIQLRKVIYSSLIKLVSKKCILLDAPYYHNIGDVLIWTCLLYTSPSPRDS